jgi:YVTN family beta-propeller protein
MKQLVIFISIAALCSLCHAVERIDDMTVIADGYIVDEPMAVDAPAELFTTQYEETRGMNDGYVGFSSSDTEDICPFDVTSYAVGSYLDLPGGSHYPYDAVMKPDGSEVWFTDATTDTIYVVDRATDTISHTIPASEYMIGMAFSGDGSIVLAGSRDDDQILVIDTATYTITGSIDNVTGAGIYAVGFLTYCPSNDRFYMTQWYDDNLYEIASDGSAVLNTITITGAELWQIVSSHDGSTLYICDRDADAVQVVDVATFTNTGSFSVGVDPWGIDITSDDKYVVVGCEDDSTVHIYDVGAASSDIITLLGSDHPRDVDILAGDAWAFVASGGSDEVLVIDLTVPILDTRISFPGASTANVVAVEPQMGPYSPVTPTPSPVPDVPATTFGGGILLLVILSGLFVIQRRQA